MSDVALYDCSAADPPMPANALFSSHCTALLTRRYSCNAMDQSLLFDLSANNLNASISHTTPIHCDYVNNSFLSLGGVNTFFPLIVPSVPLAVFAHL